MSITAVTTPAALAEWQSDTAKTVEWSGTYVVFIDVHLYRTSTGLITTFCEGETPGIQYWDIILDAYTSAEDYFIRVVDTEGNHDSSEFIIYNVFSRPLADTIGMSDSIGRSAVRALADTINMNDVTLRQIQRNLTDTIDTSDDIVRSISRSLTDVITLNESIIRRFARPLSDTLTLSDAIKSGNHLVVVGGTGSGVYALGEVVGIEGSGNGLFMLWMGDVTGIDHRAQESALLSMPEYSKAIIEAVYADEPTLEEGYTVKAGRYDFEVDQGTAFDAIVAYKQEDGSPVDVTGYTAKMIVRDYIGGAALLTLTNGSGLTIGNAEGFVQVVMTATQTAAFTFNKAVYDLEVYPAGAAADAVKLLRGTITLNKEVTI